MSLTELLEVPGVSRALRAGINRHVVGDARAYRKGSSESILTSSLAGDIVRCFLNQSNRGGRRDAEVGEGREYARVNIVQSHMQSHMSVKGMSQRDEDER